MRFFCVSTMPSYLKTSKDILPTSIKFPNTYFDQCRDIGYMVDIIYPKTLAFY